MPVSALGNDAHKGLCYAYLNDIEVAINLREERFQDLVGDIGVLELFFHIFSARQDGRDADYADYAENADAFLILLVLSASSAVSASSASRSDQSNPSNSFGGRIVSTLCSSRALSSAASAKPIAL